MYYFLNLFYLSDIDKQYNHVLYRCQLERRKIMNYKFKTKPYAHQLKALEMSWDKESTLRILWKWVLVNLKY